MDVAERIGRTAFEFNLLFSLIITFIGLGLLSNGINPGDTVKGLFLPMSWFIESTDKLQSSLPSDYEPWDVVLSLGAAGIVGIVLEFLFMILLGFLALVHAIASILPEQLLFLKVPLYFLGSFIQLMVWIYIFNIILDKLSILTPFKR